MSFFVLPIFDGVIMELEKGRESSEISENFPETYPVKMHCCWKMWEKPNITWNILNMLKAEFTGQWKFWKLKEMSVY